MIYFEFKHEPCGFFGIGTTDQPLQVIPKCPLCGQVATMTSLDPNAAADRLPRSTSVQSASAGISQTMVARGGGRIENSSQVAVASTRQHTQHIGEGARVGTAINGDVQNGLSVEGFSFTRREDEKS